MKSNYSYLWLFCPFVSCLVKQRDMCFINNPRELHVHELFIILRRENHIIQSEILLNLLEVFAFVHWAYVRATKFKQWHNVHEVWMLNHFNDFVQFIFQDVLDLPLVRHFIREVVRVQWVRNVCGGLLEIEMLTVLYYVCQEWWRNLWKRYFFSHIIVIFKHIT